MEHLDKRPGIHLKALVEELNSFRNDINSRLEAVVVQTDLGQFISHITELKQKVQQHEQLIQTLQGHQAANGTPANSNPSVIQAKVQALELKTGTFEGIVTTLHREIERCITAIENVERGRQGEKQVVDSLEKKIRALERSISLKVGLVYCCLTMNIILNVKMYMYSLAQSLAIIPFSILCTVLCFAALW